MDLKGKTAIVTGGANGIGKAYSNALAKAGAKVCIADIDLVGAEKAAQEIENSNGESIAVKVDVSNEKETVEMARKCFESFHSIDILVNNAAYFTAITRRPWDQIGIEEWERALRVNVIGMWLCCKAVFPYMKNQGRGKIINISSGTALGSPSPGFIHYVTSKGAVIAFTRALAREVGKLGIKVNAITPGLVATDTTLAIYSQEVFAAGRARRCIERDERPDDLVGTVIFLASDASEFITGQIINVDGGNIMH